MTTSKTAHPDINLPNQELVEQAYRFSQAFQRWMDQGAERVLTYPRLRVLEYLYCNGAVRMGDLAHELGLPPRNLTTVADGLEADDLAHRSPHPTDRRVTMLDITKAGNQVIEATFAPRLHEIARLFDNLTGDEKSQLLATLRTLTSAIGDASASGGHQGI